VGAGEGRDAAASPAVTRWRLWHLVAVVFVVLAAGMGFYATRRHESPSPDTLTTLRSIPVTTLPGLEVEPSLSPDGNYVAFAWDGDTVGNFDIYVKQLDVGGRPLRLTMDSADDRAPVWSPDGRQIAFVRTTPDFGAEALVVSPLGGGEKRPTASSLSARGRPSRSTNSVRTLLQRGCSRRVLARSRASRVARPATGSGMWTRGQASLCRPCFRAACDATASVLRGTASISPATVQIATRQHSFAPIGHLFQVA